MKKMTCAYCGKVFERPKKQKYCSYKCMGEAKKKHNNITLSSDYAIIHLKDGINTLIDVKDVDRVKQYYWYPYYDKTVKNYYVRTRYLGKQIILHRLIANCSSRLCVDHINRNTLDNRSANLRCVTPAINNLNRRYTRVCSITNEHNITISKYGNYVVKFVRNKKSIHIGTYKTLDEAIRMRDTWEIQHATI